MSGSIANVINFARNFESFNRMEKTMVVYRNLPNQLRLASFQRGLFSLLLAFQPLFVIPSAAYASPDIPEVIQSTEMPDLLWIGALSAVNDDGTLSSILLNSHGDTLEWKAKSQGVSKFLPNGSFQGEIDDEDCSNFSFSTSDPRGYLEPARLFKDATYIFSGIVEGAEQGFSTLFEGTLLKVRVSRVLKDSEGRPIDNSIFVLYPYSRFSLSGIEFCRRRSSVENCRSFGKGSFDR